MPKKSKPKGDSKDVAKMKKEIEVTEKKNADRHDSNKAEEAAKVETAKTESENQAPPIAVVSISGKERKEAYDDLIEQYAKENPVKYAIKKKAGQFKDMPANFSGTNALVEYNT